MSSSRRKPGFVLKKAPVEKKPTRAVRHAASARRTTQEKSSVPATTTAGTAYRAKPAPRGGRKNMDRAVREAPVRARGPRPIPNEALYPMRINKYLAQQGHATRREADTLVEKKAVLINGRIAQVGDKIEEGDVVEVRRNVRPGRYTYLAFNKPVDVDTHKEATGSENILDSLPPEVKQLKLFPIGRLDKASHGLIILTNDGRITDRLLNPDHAHEKTYEVRTKLPLRATFKENMEGGVLIEGYMTRPAKVNILGEKAFRITLTEGKSHQIRRMVSALHNEVSDLRRMSIMNIKIGALKGGAFRPIEGEELSEFLHALGLA
ncbi:MAG: rRNA pseudouridine synthase [Candidatus Pacebacteria bacterium]|nr:rRNA pseudouridine synthase [Candidatus Paceibacterota bacterium]